MSGVDNATRVHLVLLFFVAMVANPALAAAKKQPVSASPDYFTFSQPDGVSFVARKFGDEFYHWMETDAGWTIAWNAISKRYQYVDVGDNGRFEFTELTVGVDDPAAAEIPKHLRETLEAREQRREEAKRAMLEQAVSGQAADVPSVGVVKNLVILANFSDTTSTYSQEDFNNLFNTIGYNQNGAKGSVRDYYNEASYGNLQIFTTVSPWVTLPRTKAYYGANDIFGNDRRPRRMITDAIAALEADGFDFSVFDNDEDGWIDSFSVIHQGPGEEAGGGADCIWSHAWSISPVLVDGVWIDEYHTEPETYRGDLTTIGVICHEFGHALGIPDLYDTDISSEGIGEWGVMASGSWNDSGRRPAHFCSWSKVQLGWVIPTLFGTSQTDIDIARLSINAQAYKITSGMANNEYLLVENRQNSGEDFDDSLPGSGLLVYHIDENRSNNRDENYYMVGLLQADGLRDLENNTNRGDAGDPYPGLTNNPYLGTGSNPNTNSYYNGNTSIAIGNISDSNDSINFDLSLEGIIQISFPDINLKTAVEAHLGIFNPTASDMLTMFYLNANSRAIANLTGLEYARNIMLLSLAFNQINNIQPLSGLRNLKVLNLAFNQISDISALSGLENLVILNLAFNQVSDISPLFGLPNLRWLLLIGNPLGP